MRLTVVRPTFKCNEGPYDPSYKKRQPLCKKKKERKEKKGVRWCTSMAPQEEKKRGRMPHLERTGKTKKKKKRRRRSKPLVPQEEKLRSTKIQWSDLQSVLGNVILALGSSFLPIVLR